MPFPLLLIVFLSVQTALSSLIFANTISSSGTIKSSNIPWLHTEGNLVKNELGETVFLRGAAFGGIMPNPPQPAYWHSGTAWKQYVPLSGGRANIIRCMASLVEYWPDGVSLLDDAMDRMVNYCVANDIYVMLDFHGGIGRTEAIRIANDPSDWINWMAHWAERYKSIPNVFFELWNEPYDAWLDPLGEDNRSRGGDNWCYNMVPQFCDTILKVNPKALFVVYMGEKTFFDRFQADPLPYNVIYSHGFYYRQQGDYFKQPYRDGDYDLAYQRWRNDYLIALHHIDFGLVRPVMTSEFGWALKFDEPARAVNMQHSFNILKEFNTHWTQWDWWPNPYNYGLLNTDYTLNDPIGTVWAQNLWDESPP